MHTFVIATHPLGRWQARMATVSPMAWLGLQAAALWPHWRWVAARVADGSDDPLGVAALLVLCAVVMRLEPRLRAQPSPGWLLATLIATGAATLSLFHAPALIGALLAALAMAFALRAFMPIGEAMLPTTGLAVLALPVVSSLQFYAGFPLRVVTAQLSTWLLQAWGFAAQRSGTAMEVSGQLVIVDAPCSGVQMVWMAYFCACTMAALHGLGDRALLARLPYVGAIVLMGNVVRNSVLVAMEVRPGGVRESLHQGIGLAVLAAVCMGVVTVMRGGRDAKV